MATLTASSGLSLACLQKQNAETSNAIIDYLSSCPNQKIAHSFTKLSEAEGTLIANRDAEDGAKLQKGIDLALEKGVIDKNFVPEPYIDIDVLGKSAGQVADELLSHVKEPKGSIIVICGLSGTGKGTTVTMLQQKLGEQGAEVVCWSNGNIFRSVTLLAATWCEQNTESGVFDPACLTKENLASFINMLEFGQFNGKFDTRIKGLGLDLLVSDIQNTDLKQPKVAKNIPTVAEVTQGEVILFAADAVKKMGAAGITVLLEGRKETVNYVRTPYRFTLILSDASLIGKRRAAQRIMADALKAIGDDVHAQDDKVIAKIQDSLNTMVQAIE